jgi:magnesium transporter
MIECYCFHTHRSIAYAQTATDCWIRLVAPTDAEIERVASASHIDPAHLRSSLDKEATSRVATFDGYLMLIADVPVVTEQDGVLHGSTAPVTFITTPHNVITVCLVGTPTFSELIAKEGDKIDPSERMDFVCRFLLVSTELFQRFLRQVDEEREKMVKALGNKTRNEDLVRLHDLEATLVYFETSLRGNKLVFDLAANDEHLAKGLRDIGVFGELQLETDQAIEMTSTYRELIRSTRELFSAIIDNTLNSVMKILTSLTVILAIPAIISGFYGMNVGVDSMPFSTHPYAFYIICASTVLICIVLGVWLHRKNLM